MWLYEPAPITPLYVVIFYDKPLQRRKYTIKGEVIKPDIVWWHRTEKLDKIIEISVPNDFGLNRAEKEKMNKYKALKHNLKDVFNLKMVENIPVIVGASGLVKKNLSDLLQNIPRELELPELTQCHQTHYQRH